VAEHRLVRCSASQKALKQLYWLARKLRMISPLDPSDAPLRMETDADLAVCSERSIG
jgi:hypothetical protein